MQKENSRRYQQGAETVEFMITLPVFLLVFFMIIDIAITVYDRGALLNASREGNRQASLFWVDPLLFDPEAADENQQLKRAMVDSVMTWTEDRLIIDPNDAGLTLTLQINGVDVVNPITPMSQLDRVSVNINYQHGFIGLAQLTGVDGPSLTAQSGLGVE